MTVYSKQELINAAARYAAANRSDPFAFNRAMHYLKQHDFKPPFTPDGRTTYYDAEATTETRELPDGTEYQAVVYKNISRP